MKTLIFSLFLFVTSSLPSMAQEKIRLGWQVPWTLQGQIVQVLKRTEILKKNGLAVEFVGRTFGPELNEAALAGALDVVLTADQPAAALFQKSDQWSGIGRLMYNRTSTYVPAVSPLKSLKDLKGKTIGLPVGAAAERIFYEALSAAGLEKKDVKVTHLNMLEHLPLVKRSSVESKSWDQFDALAGFDPIPAILEAEGRLKTLHAGKVCSLILMKKGSGSRIGVSDEKLAKALIKSIDEAYTYYKKNFNQVNQWFAEEAKMKDVPLKVFELTNALEPNFQSKQNRLWFTDEDFEILQSAAEFVRGKEKSVNMRERVTNAFAKP